MGAARLSQKKGVTGVLLISRRRGEKKGPIEGEASAIGEKVGRNQASGSRLPGKGKKRGEGSRLSSNESPFRLLCLSFWRERGGEGGTENDGLACCASSMEERSKEARRMSKFHHFRRKGRRGGEEKKEGEVDIFLYNSRGEKDRSRPPSLLLLTTRGEKERDQVTLLLPQKKRENRSSVLLLHEGKRRGGDGEEPAVLSLGELGEVTIVELSASFYQSVHAAWDVGVKKKGRGEGGGINFSAKERRVIRESLSFLTAENSPREEMGGGGREKLLFLVIIRG